MLLFDKTNTKYASSSKYYYKNIMKGVETMFKVEENGLMLLTRGDTARFKVGGIMNYACNPPEPYTILPTDTLEFSVKKNVKDSEPLIHKLVYGDNPFHILPADTKDLSFGRYVYDIQLTTADGDVYTVTALEPPTFELLKEVT